MRTGYDRDNWRALQVVAEQSLEQTKAAERRNDLLEVQNRLLERIATVLELMLERRVPRL